MVSRFVCILGTAAVIVLSAGTVFAARPAIEARTSLRHCGHETCLLVSGRRADATAAILLAGHGVAVQGDRRWHASISLETLRSWSAPAARTIGVGVAGRSASEIAVPLPAGLLGQRTELAFLDVRAR